MCFSAPVSFATSAALAVVGVQTMKRATPRRRFIAAIPFMFSVQQAIEGVQWLLDRPSLCSQVFGYGFLFFAFFVWPVYIPLSVWYAEHVRWRRRVLLVLAGIGIALAAYFIAVVFHEPLSVASSFSRIQYVINIPYFAFSATVYVFATTSSFLLSSHRPLRWFGVTSFIAAVISWWFFAHAFTSVWCFFAAALSIGLYWWTRKSAS